MCYSHVYTVYSHNAAQEAERSVPPCTFSVVTDYKSRSWLTSQCAPAHLMKLKYMLHHVTSCYIQHHTASTEISQYITVMSIVPSLSGPWTRSWTFGWCLVIKFKSKSPRVETQWWQAEVVGGSITWCPVRNHIDFSSYSDSFQHFSTMTVQNYEIKLIWECQTAIIDLLRPSFWDTTCASWLWYRFT